MVNRHETTICAIYSDLSRRVYTPNDGLERESPPKGPYFRFRNYSHSNLPKTIWETIFVAFWAKSKVMEMIGLNLDPPRMHRVFNWCILGVGPVSNPAKYSSSIVGSGFFWENLPTQHPRGTNRTNPSIEWLTTDPGYPRNKHMFMVVSLNGGTRKTAQTDHF